MIIFVYGTLLAGLFRHTALAEAQFLGYATLNADLYDVCTFPGILPGDGKVFGECYRIHADTLRELDYIEVYDSLHPQTSLYIRKPVSVQYIHTGEQRACETYFYNGELDYQIVSGDYRRYLHEYQEKNWYIAYGSNMSSERLSERIGILGERITGYLPGFQLVFNKQSNKGGAVANLRFHGAGYRCPFVAYAVSTEQLATLDAYEGVPIHYQRWVIPFICEAQAQCNFGHIYLANPDRLLNGECDIAPEYLRYIYAGYQEHGFEVGALP